MTLLFPWIPRSECTLNYAVRTEAWWLECWGVIATFAAFALIIVMVRLGKDLGLATLAGSLILLAVLAPASIPSTLVTTLLDAKTVYLIVISFVIVLFAEIYEVTGAG